MMPSRGLENQKYNLRRLRRSPKARATRMTIELQETR
jgi:hypothetical protein